MVTELEALENKIAQVVALCRALRAENHDLQRQLSAITAEKQKADARMLSARERLEALLDKIPEPKA